MKSRKFLLLAGTISLLGGFLALYNPLITSITLEQILGWTCLFSGVFYFFNILTNKGEQQIWSIFLAISTIFLGYFFISMPLESLISITVFIIALLAGSGISRLVLAFKQRNSSFFIPMLFSGMISLLLSAILLSGFLGAVEELLGIIFAIELISSGISLIACTWALGKNSASGQLANK